MTLAALDSAFVPLAAEEIVATVRDDCCAARMPAAPRPTPQTTVEAVMYSVLERGLKALKEPATQERLRRCDAAAQEQIIQRIEMLHAAGRIPGGDADV